jgi:hypothetical protein
VEALLERTNILHDGILNADLRALPYLIVDDGTKEGKEELVLALSHAKFDLSDIARNILHPEEVRVLGRIVSSKVELEGDAVRQIQ